MCFYEFYGGFKVWLFFYFWIILLWLTFLDFKIGVLWIISLSSSKLIEFSESDFMYFDSFLSLYKALDFFELILYIYLILFLRWFNSAWSYELLELWFLSWFVDLWEGNSISVIWWYSCIDRSKQWWKYWFRWIYHAHQ